VSDEKTAPSPGPSEDLRVGVFVCDCGLNIAGTVDTAAVTEYATTLENVVAVVRNRYTCAEPGQNEIKNAVREHGLNRVVVASCTPLMHEPTFRACIASVGLNPYLLEMANLREHCSWVHGDDKAGATAKAKDLVKSAVARASRLRARKESRLPVTQAALVIGGGVAGIQASLDLADAGYQVYLVEKEPSIGGIMAQLDKTYPTMDCSI
jgi:heterodisulfide reductase subunit A